MAAVDGAVSRRLVRKRGKNTEGEILSLRRIGAPLFFFFQVDEGGGALTNKILYKGEEIKFSLRLHGV